MMLKLKMRQEKNVIMMMWGDLTPLIVGVYFLIWVIKDFLRAAVWFVGRPLRLNEAVVPESPNYLF